MSVFVKIYAHHGWRYYLPLGVVKPEPELETATML